MRKTNKVFYRAIQLPFKIKRPTLALGSHTKNALCFARGSLAYFSPVHPDLNNPKDFSNFEKDVRYFLKQKPKIIAYDLHPEYQSSKYILNLTPNTYHLSPVQHHHAHIVSSMAENGMRNQKVIGIAFDGTGLGSDDNLWGAEFLLCDYKKFKRVAHLKEIPLLGGERAILEPWRVAALYLYLAYKGKFPDLNISFVKGIDKKKWNILKDMYLKGINAPLASSMGRLFDAAASLVLAKYKAKFEAELAIELERMAKSCACLTGRQELRAKSYRYKIIKTQEKYIINPLPIFKQIVSELKRREQKEKIAYQFHLTIAEMIRKMSLILKKETGINTVVLSGGVFQNNLLLNSTLDLLYREGFRVIRHKKLSCNDSAISLGQAVISNFRP